MAEPESSLSLWQRDFCCSPRSCPPGSLWCVCLPFQTSSLMMLCTHLCMDNTTHGFRLVWGAYVVCAVCSVSQWISLPPCCVWEVMFYLAIAPHACCPTQTILPAYLFGPWASISQDEILRSETATSWVKSFFILKRYCQSVLLLVRTISPNLKLTSSSVWWVKDVIFL